MSGGPDDGNRDAFRDAFSVLAHDIRLDIVLALLEGWAGVHTEPRGYAELMDAVGMADSGKFNYHLDKLRGIYVEEIEEGYVPTAAATALYRAVLAHRPTERTDWTETVDEDCPECGGRVVERYERSFLTFACADCEDWSLTYSFPANGLGERTGETRRRALANRASYHAGLARTGQCPFCAGRVGVELDPRPDWTDERGGTPVELSCETCSWLVVVDVLVGLQFEPRVVAGLSALGIEHLPVDGRDAERTGSVSTDPPRVTVEVATDEGTMTVVADEDLAVRSVEVATDG